MLLCTLNCRAKKITFFYYKIKEKFFKVVV